MPRVLIVDDEKNIRLVLEEFLLEEGYEVETAEDVEEATRRLEESHFDVVVSDILFPRVTGVELLHLIHQKKPEIRVIMITGEPTVETAAEAVRAGAYDYLSKPIKRADFCKIVNAAVREKSLNDEKKRLQEENEQHRKRLVQLVEDLRRANDDLKAFGYSVSHDLRAPLRAITGFSRIIMETQWDQLPPETQHYMKIINESALRMEQLLDALLKFSQLGQRALQKQLVDQNDLIKQIITELQPEHEGRQIEWHLHDLPSWQADPHLLKQVYFNLINNALKYSDKDKPLTIEVGVREEERDGALRKVFFVRDTGIGFDMRYADKMFDVFRRLHNDQQYEGTGVGLSIVQRIIQRHGGQIWADSVVGQGSTFSFYLGD